MQAGQQLLDSSTRHPGRDLRRKRYHAGVYQCVWTLWADPSYSSALYISHTDEETGQTTKTLDETACAEICRQLTLRLLSGDGISLDTVDESSEPYRTQYEAVRTALTSWTASTRCWPPR